MANIWVKPEFVKVQESVRNHEFPLWMYAEASSQVNLIFCFVGCFEFLHNLKLLCTALKYQEGNLVTVAYTSSQFLAHPASPNWQVLKTILWSHYWCFFFFGRN